MEFEPSESAKSTPRFDDLVDISTRLFREHGFAGTTVRMIAKEMGVLSGSLYSHISSKDEILQRIAMSVATLFFERVRTIAAEPLKLQGLKLRKMAHAHLSVIRDRQDAVSVYFDEWRRLDATHRSTVSLARREYRQLFVDVIVAGANTGEFERSNANQAANMLLAACNSTYQFPDGSIDAEELSEKYTGILIHGIVKRMGNDPLTPDASRGK